ncbi:LysR family transcriptional regulator [Paenirhodobacter populi]|uniref:LysR family transcriptional regulator n=1 Tax=Paenirhodobacter populi TaxID=2306993 RepID=A0A443K5F1_9RHOB|nr:LysR family transcriptional regulator [Sinirhodobacter populi]RWR06923.1 LysR family transcriptional regulator [Sinirhodobacter populi]RWR28007.1 LysR family transcriptional regulator [Sinirhodobacter populi]
MNQFSQIPNLRHLRMVQVIGKLGGVSCASRELSTSQPAVTQAVANLEAEIGVPIFERCATGTYPTAVGRQYLLRLDRFFEILDRAVAQVMGRAENEAERALVQADRLMTGTQMRALMVTCEAGRVSEIAENLGMSPASLSRSARTLERTLGRALFDRTAQGPIPNRTGAFLVREFRRAVRELELARGEVMLAAGAGSLELGIGALPMAGSHELAQATRRFMAAYPSVRVRLVSGEYHKLLADLGNSQLDMIFGILRKPDWATDVAEEILFRDRYCMVARPGHPLAALEEVSPADMADYEWVVPAVGTPRRNRIEAIFEGEDRRPSFHLETASLTMSRTLLLCSDTITLMTRSEVQYELDLGILVALPCPYLDNVLLKGVTTRSDWLPTPAHTAFLDCLRAITAETRHDRIERRPTIKLAS